MTAYLNYEFSVTQEKGIPLPKFGEWDVNDPASAEGFTVIFNKARNEKKTGGKIDSPGKDDSTYKQSHAAALGKPQSVSCTYIAIAFGLPISQLHPILSDNLMRCFNFFDKIFIYTC